MNSEVNSEVNLEQNSEQNDLEHHLEQSWLLQEWIDYEVQLTTTEEQLQMNQV